MKSKFLTPALMVGGAVVLVAAFLLLTLQPPGDPIGAHVDLSLERSVESAPVPSKANLDHALVAKEQRLKERLLRNPQDDLVQIQLARFYHDSHRPADAASHYAVYLEQHPEARQVWLDLADCLGATGEWERAREAMTDFLGRWPDDPTGMYNLGAIYANSGRQSEAREWWGRVRDQSVDPTLSSRASESLARL